MGLMKLRGHMTTRAYLLQLVMSGPGFFFFFFPYHLKYQITLKYGDIIVRLYRPPLVTNAVNTYQFIALYDCVFSFRTSVQKNIASLKVKAQVIIELPLSVTG